MAEHLLTKDEMIQGEIVRYETRPFFGLFFNLPLLVFCFALFWPWLLIVVLLLVLLGIAQYYSAVYAITNKRVISRGGFIVKNCIQCPLNKVQNAEYHGSVLGIASVVFDTAGTTQKEIVWKLSNARGTEAYQTASEVLHDGVK